MTYVLVTAITFASGIRVSRQASQGTTTRPESASWPTTANRPPPPGQESTANDLGADLDLSQALLDPVYQLAVIAAFARETPRPFHRPGTRNSRGRRSRTGLRHSVAYYDSPLKVKTPPDTAAPAVVAAAPPLSRSLASPRALRRRCCRRRLRWGLSAFCRGRASIREASPPNRAAPTAARRSIAAANRCWF